MMNDDAEDKDSDAVASGPGGQPSSRDELAKRTTAKSKALKTLSSQSALQRMIKEMESPALQRMMKEMDKPSPLQRMIKEMESPALQRMMKEMDKPSPLQQMIKEMESPALQRMMKEMESPSALQRMMKEMVSPSAFQRMMKEMESPSAFQRMMKSTGVHRAQFDTLATGPTSASSLVTEFQKMMRSAQEAWGPSLGGLTGSLFVDAAIKRSVFDPVGYASGAMKALENSRLQEGAIAHLASAFGKVAATGALFEFFVVGPAFSTLKAAGLARSVLSAQTPNGISPFFRSVAKQQEQLLGPSSAIRRILKQVEETHTRFASLTNNTLMGSLAASLATAPSPAAFGVTIADAAAIVADARQSVRDDALWAQARDRSALVEGIASLADADTAGTVPSDKFVTVLEQQTQRIERIFAHSASPAYVLFIREYLGIILAIITLILTYAAMTQEARFHAEDMAQPEYGPAIIERLDRMADPLQKLAVAAQNKVAEAVVIVCKANASVRQRPMQKSKAVWKFQPGDKAIFISEANGWVEVEFVEPLSGETRRGWVYGKLVTRIR